MNKRQIHLFIGGLHLRDALRCARETRRLVAAGETSRAICAYLDGTEAHWDSFGRAPQTSRDRVLRALLDAKRPLLERVREGTNEH